MASVPQIPPDFRAVRNRFVVWRKAKAGREKIPERLWSQAAALGKRHGVNLVSQWRMDVIDFSITPRKT